MNENELEEVENAFADVLRAVVAELDAGVITPGDALVVVGISVLTVIGVGSAIEELAAEAV